MTASPAGPMDAATGVVSHPVSGAGGTIVAAAAGGCSMAAAAAFTVDLLNGLDARWAVAANLLLFAPAVVLALLARQSSGGVAVALTTAGLLVAPTGAFLGDQAGHTWWWLLFELAWWTGLMLAFWRSRPGLSVVSGAAAAGALVAAVLVGLSVPEPVASAAGLRVPLTIVWAVWAAADLAVRPMRPTERRAARPGLAGG